MKTNTIRIEGRRWFQTTYGNTYNTVKIWINGELVATLPMEYGYGDYYLQRAEKWLSDNDYLPNKAEYEAIWNYCRDHDIELSYYAIDCLKRELHKVAA